MSEKRLLYFSATRVALYRWAARRLALEQSFANGEEGAEGFAGFLQSMPKSLFYVLVDIVEEDFHQETIPFVRGGDRKALLTRKLAQRYRDTSLSLAVSLGYEKTQRRDERVLFSSFTNNAQFQPWLEALRENELPVVGVFSIALLAPQLGAKLGVKKGPAMLVSLQQAGLRQSFVDEGQIRFSRLGPLEPADAEDPDRVAQAFDRETTRVYQYLTAMRVVARDGGAPIDAVLVAPSGQKQRVEAAAPSMPHLRVAVVDLAEAARTIGLAAYPENSGAEVLYLHLLAQRAPSQQYAGDTLRQFFRLRQLRAVLVAGGALAAALLLAWSAFLLAQYFGLEELADRDRQNARVANDGYARVTGGFPNLPTTTDNLRLTMQKYGALTKQSVPPERLVSAVSAALASSPRIELDRLNWELTANPRQRLDAAQSSGRPAGAPPTAPGAPQAAKALYELAVIEGRVLGIRPSDYKSITTVVTGFMDALAAQPGVEVMQRKMPFELGSETRLSGDIGSETSTTATATRFTVTVSRKVATE